MFSTINLVKLAREFLYKEFAISVWDDSITEADLEEVFTFKYLHDKAPTIFPRYNTSLQKLGDAVLDYHIIDILVDHHYNSDDVQSMKEKLVGNNADQPLNQLFDKWELKQFFPGEELSNHQKADVVEALFGLLERKKKLTREQVLKIFTPFGLPPKRESSAAKPIVSVTEIIADLKTLQACINWHSKLVTDSLDEIVKAIVKKIEEKPKSELGSLIEQINLLIKNYGESRLVNQFFNMMLDNDKIPLEKFVACYGSSKKESDIFIHTWLSVSPLKLSKLLAFYRLNDRQKQELTIALLTDVGKLTVEYANIIETLTQDFDLAFIIVEFNKLKPEQQALFPKLNRLKYFAELDPISNKLPKKSVDQLVELSAVELAASLNMIRLGAPLIVEAVKNELEGRMKGASSKTKTKYQTKLDGIKPLITATARSATVIASTSAALGGGSGCSAAPR